MSVTHPEAVYLATRRRDFISRHPQLAPFLVALGLFVASVVVALSATGLPV
jgi:hypothetical protein